MRMTKREINDSVKNDFKILRENKNLVFLNSSATSLKPDVFIDELTSRYSNHVSTMNKGFNRTNHKSKSNTEQFFITLDKVARHINSEDKKNVIPTYGTTDFINKFASKIIDKLRHGDEIILGKYEHASNILPWVNLIKESKKDIIIKWYKLKNWTVDLDHLRNIVTDKTKLMSVALIYNTTGAKNDISAIRGVLGNKPNLIVDAAQAIGHIKIDVTIGDVDCLFFGAHKVFGPNSLGFAYIKNLLSWKTPFNYGGEMNKSYSEYAIEYKEGRKKFIAGTQDIPGIISFGKSIDYLESFDINEIEKYNCGLKKYAEKKIGSLPNIRIINKDIESSNLFFEVKNTAGEDVAYHLFHDQILVRWGSNCVKIKNNDYEAYKSIRASFHIYNNRQDIDKLYDSLKNGGDFIEALFKKRPSSEICL